MMSKVVFRGLAVAALVAAAAPAGAVTLKVGGLTGDSTRGAAAFAPCKTCHVTAAGQNRIGPSLNGIVGRHSGQYPGYHYSMANMKSGIVWTPDKMFVYLENPQKYVPGTKMTYGGLKDPQKRADVIAWLSTQTQK